jgi:hypothetical protein
MSKSKVYWVSLGGVPLDNADNADPGGGGRIGLGGEGLSEGDGTGAGIVGEVVGR